MCVVYANMFVNKWSIGCVYSQWNTVLEYCPDSLKKNEIKIPSFILNLTNIFYD